MGIMVLHGAPKQGQKTHNIKNMIYIYIWLVDFRHPAEKYEFASWDNDIPNIWENNPVMFQSPPTRYIYIDIHSQGQTMTIVFCLPPGYD